MAKPNEYYMLRRAARHLIVDLWTSDELWSQPERIQERYAAVKVLRELALTMPDKPSERRRSIFLDFTW